MDLIASQANTAEDQASSTSRFVTKVGRRARKACLSCRSRKVRCDVSLRGRPCMNCYLDSTACVVTGRASKYRSAQYDSRDGIQASLPPYPPLTPRVPGGEVVAGSTLHSAPVPDGPEPDNFSQNIAIEESHNSPVESLPHLPNYPSPDSQWSSLLPAGAPDIVYFYYKFLTVTNMRSIPHQDVNFLEQQGCLRVPVRPLLDDLVQQYFLHVHPFLPLVNEGDFWDLYYDNSNEQHISLLLFQAMLFASCNFVSQSTIEALGHPDIRSMRATFLRRAKLLNDFGTESSPLVISQAALLLSFTSLSPTKKANTWWLGLAIENAKLAEAHLYTSIPTTTAAATPALQHHRAILKRVWWCCIIRDRSIGLLMRRPIQITGEHFAFHACPLTTADFTDEFARSRVYNPATKRRLAEILTQSVQLYITLTDILLLVFPLNGTRGSDSCESRHSIKIQDCKAALRQWYESATSTLQNDTATTLPMASGNGDIDRDSTILYTTFMFMYYHTSRIVLCHHEVLHLDTLQNGALAATAQDQCIILENQRELQNATSDITQCHGDLVRLGLVRWLPLSAGGCTALPLVLNILDIKLDSSLTSSSSSSSPPKCKQLEIFNEVMKTYWRQYDEVDWISEIVRHIVTTLLTTINNSKNKTTTATTSRGNSNSKPRRISWTDIFAFQPSSYLRLTLALDFSLGKGRLPQDGDLLLGLKKRGGGGGGLFAVNVGSPLKELLIGGNGSMDFNEGYGNHDVLFDEESPDSDSPPRFLPERDACEIDGALLDTMEEDIYLQLAGGSQGLER